jgi:diguanylate cyclase (GGDEF)-like protein/PAS domain S-box-containing protein
LHPFLGPLSFPALTASAVVIRRGTRREYLMRHDIVNVMIVDGDSARADALVAMLRAEPAVRFEVSRATCLADAVEALKAAVFDAVLASLALPDSQGLPTLAILMAYVAHAPVIVLSENENDATALRALQHGAEDHLPRHQLYATPVVRTIRHSVERSRAEVALRESEQRYRMLFQQSRDAIYIADPDGRILEVNRAALELFGYRAEELVGRTLASLFADPDDCERLQRETARAGSVRDTEVRVRTSDRREIWCLLSTAERRAPNGTSLGSQGIIHDISERKRVELQLQHDALHDSLTGLPNRVLFMDRLEQAVRRSEREIEEPFGILFIDLDRFKGVNDTLGHAAGDEVLRRTADLLLSCVRDVDTVGRLGGDEFVVLLDRMAATDDAMEVAERILDRLDRPYELRGREFFTTASIGITWLTDLRASPTALLREADIAMYRAKSRGGARYEVFQPAMHSPVASGLEVESDLRHALSGHQFVLHYQPILSFDSGRTMGFEALARWQHPQRGLLPPDSFIPLAEKTGLIVPFGFWALREAARQLREWSDTVPAAADTIMSVNISPRQFLETTLVEGIFRIFDEERIEPERIRLELTEGALMHDVEHAERTLSTLHRTGFRLCLDDFGTGYSSLAQLQRFPLDIIKVDRSFVARLDDSPRDLELVASITRLARKLGIHALVEGVETEAQLERLRDLRPREVQGFLFSRAVEPAAAAAFLGATRAGLPPQATSIARRILRRLRRLST